MSHLDMHVFICREDNYGVLVHDPKSGATAAIDAPEAAAIERELKRKGWQLTHIFTTHHHFDHVEGNLHLKDQFGCTIIGPAEEASEIPGINKQVKGGDSFKFAGRDVHVIATPGHTKGHIAYHIPSDYSAFVGDTLFALGCGRVIEGTMDEMWASLAKLRKLSPHTYIYCGHEYTEANARFALTIEPGNRALQQRAETVSRQRAKGEKTVPSILSDELRTNPFLRWDSPEIRANLAMEKATDAEVFAEVRKRKNNFK
jgi:hydroxyacylglutathione hydrolase